MILDSLIPFLAESSEPTFWMPRGASTHAAQVDGVFDFITWLCIFFFVLIVALTVLFMVKYRRTSPDQKATGTSTHNTPLELTWTIIPLILVVAIFYVGMDGYLELRQAPAGSYEINVTAQKWSWQFDYPNGCQSTELIVPVGTPVKLIMQSQDVLHAMFIPAFRVKQDIVPGRLTTLWFECTEAGDYPLFCAEYCGTDHSQMVGMVRALPEGEFEAALEECANVWDQTPDDQLYTLGPRLYSRCKSCHTLDGSSSTGPTWEGLWERTVAGETVFTNGDVLADIMGPGKTYENPEDYMYQSILNPQKHVVENYPGSMSQFSLPPRAVIAVIEMMKNLDKFDKSTGKLLPDGQ